DERRFLLPPLSLYTLCKPLHQLRQLCSPLLCFLLRSFSSKRTDLLCLYRRLYLQKTLLVPLSKHRLLCLSLAFISSRDKAEKPSTPSSPQSPYNYHRNASSLPSHCSSPRPGPSPTSQSAQTHPSFRSAPS
ncbi:hypothetical protein SERLA73DRAFT_185737, partial [Serpula lacrymans var. lacrymans S7.3]